LKILVTEYYSIFPSNKNKSEVGYIKVAAMRVKKTSCPTFEGVTK